MKDAFDIAYDPYDKDKATVLLDFEVTEFTDMQKFTIQLDFDDPLFVSFNSQANSRSSEDRIFVSLKDTQIFLDPKDDKVISPNLLQKQTVQVPKQLPKSSEA